jgi:tRNA threonylcarbamoyladenosine biosynthesis protein TsaE
MDFCFDAADEAATAALGAALAELLPDGTTVALCGTLGAGKTRLAQAIAVGCGVPPGQVVSPTFVLAQEHRGRRTVYHVDAYRVRDEDEFWQLGPDEWFESDGLTLVEWADRVPGCLPADRLEVHIEVVGPAARRFRLRAVGHRYAAVLDTLSANLSR